MHHGDCLDSICHVCLTPGCQVLIWDRYAVTAPSACTHGSFNRRRKRKCHQEFVQSSPQGNVNTICGVLKELPATQPSCSQRGVCGLEKGVGWMDACVLALCQQKHVCAPPKHRVNRADATQTSVSDYQEAHGDPFRRPAMHQTGAAGGEHKEYFGCSICVGSNSFFWYM